MVVNYCSVEGCSSSNRKSLRRKRKEGLPETSIFKVPKELDILEIWNESLPEGHKKLKHNDFVCSLHFNYCDIQTHFEIIVNGEICRLERGVSKLKKTAVPRIFPDYSSTSNKDQLLPANKANQEIGNQNLLVDGAFQNNCENILDWSDDESETDPFSFSFLKDNLDIIQTLNSSWKTVIFDDCIVFGQFSPDYVMERKIIIAQDLTVKVYLKEIESAIGKGIGTMECMNDISDLIKRVDETTICCGLGKYDHCVGFLDGILICKKHSLCVSCIKWKKGKAVK